MAKVRSGTAAFTSLSLPPAPVLATMVLIVGLGLVHLTVLPVGGPSLYDEFYTLDRSTSFLRTGDWLSVVSESAPSFKKPPLQYWMTAGLIATGLSETVALRLPSLMFVLGTLAATAAMVRALAPEMPWAMPVSVLLLACSTQMWLYGNSGMLDTGAAFFATLAFAGAAIALKRPRVWYLVAAAIAFGALQKAPAALPLLGFGLLGLRLTQRGSGFDVRTVTRDRDFRRAFWLALAGTSAWPALQAVRHGLDTLRRSHDREMIERFAPDLAEGVRGLPSLGELMIVDEPWLRVPAFAAALALPFLLRRPAAILVTSILVAYTMALLLAGGDVYPRYSLIVLPIAAASLAILLLRMPPVPWAGVLAAVLILGLSGGPANLAPLRAAATVPPGLAMQVATLKAVGDEMRPGETLIYCRTEDIARLVPGAVSAYAARGRPMLSSRVLLEPGDEPLAGPLRGLCPDGAMADLLPRLEGFSVAWSRAGYTHWTATGLRP